MGDKVFMNGECSCPGNKGTYEYMDPDLEPENWASYENFDHIDTCVCPPNMVDDGTGTDNCVTGK